MSIPSKKPIQEAFGDSIIDTIHRFAEADLEDVTTLQTKYLFHIGNPSMQRTLAETLYGARWLYKLGLALLVKDEKQMAHVRAQLIDYCSVCEGVLSDMVAHGIAKGHFRGRCFQYHNFKKLTGELDWSAPQLNKTLESRSFAWLIAVAHEERIINQLLSEGLEWLRKERNSVHLRARTYQAYLGRSHSAFHQMAELFKQTQKWKNRYP